MVLRTIARDRDSFVNSGGDKKLAEEDAHIETILVDGSVDEAKELLAHGISPNWTSAGPGHNSALWWATTGNNEPVVKMLLDSGANPNLGSSSPTTDSPIFAAAGSPNPQILEDLIQAGANVNVKSEFGQTPVTVAVGSNQDQTLEILLKNGADPSADPRVWDFAQASQNPKILQVLQAYGYRLPNGK